MTGRVVKFSTRERPVELPPTYIGYCCREWVLALGFRGGRCGLCGERPAYLRPDDRSADA